MDPQRMKLRRILILAAIVGGISGCDIRSNVPDFDDTSLGSDTLVYPRLGASETLQTIATEELETAEEIERKNAALERRANALRRKHSATE